MSDSKIIIDNKIYLTSKIHNKKSFFTDFFFFFIDKIVPKKYIYIYIFKYFLNQNENFNSFSQYNNYID
jgi:hypothetical protein